MKMFGLIRTQFKKIPKLFIYLALCAYVLLLVVNYLTPSLPSSLPETTPRDPKKLPKLKTKMKFHNTLIVDKFLPKDFAKKFKPPGNNIFEKIVLAEQSYNETRLARAKKIGEMTGNITGKSLVANFPPEFKCPHQMSRLTGKGNGTSSESLEWNFCGLQEYSRDQAEPPEECTIYMIRSNLESAGMNILNQLGELTWCHIFYFHPGNYTRRVKLRKEGRVSVVGGTKFYVKANNDKKALLRTLIENQGHGWVDMLFFDLDGQDQLVVLSQTLADFVQVYANAQMYFRFKVAQGLKFLESWAEFDKWMVAMEKKGFRTFYANHKEVDKDGVKFTTAEYGFFNIRGKHLLLGRGRKPWKDEETEL